MVVAMEDHEIPSEYIGWWRITENSQWINEDLDALGPALISISGSSDRLRMLYLLAHVVFVPAKTGLSFIGGLGVRPDVWDWQREDWQGRTTRGADQNRPRGPKQVYR